jgi:dienelactone hydrolase
LREIGDAAESRYILIFRGRLNHSHSIMITSTNARRSNKTPLFFLLAVTGLVLIGLTPAARARGTTGLAAIEEVGSQEYLMWDGATDPRTMPPRPMNEKVFRVPVDSDDTRLIVTLLTPNGPGPFPLAVVNHGASGKLASSRVKRNLGTLAAAYFLSRGYAVVLPMMRGFSRSYGEQPYHGCDLARLGIANAQDINAVIDAMASRPEIDASRIIVAGQSLGGWNTLAFGTLGRKGVAGLVNFNGGVRESDCRDGDRALLDNVEKFAAATHVPSIWFYGQTDTIFRPEVWNAIHASYVAKGGQAELVDIGSFFTDSHQFLSYPEALSRWVPRLDAFLERVGMPHSPVFPDYMPSAWPDPSGYAALDNVDKIPYLTDAARNLYRSVFLDHKLPRALVISPRGDLAASFGGFDQVADALKDCETKFHHACRVYAIDNDVVWRPFPDPPPPSHYAALQDAGAIPYLGQSKFKFYPLFLSKPLPRALMISPDGKAYGYYGKNAFEQAMANCLAHSAHCEPYVVNDDVVWSGPGK